MFAIKSKFWLFYVGLLIVSIDATALNRLIIKYKLSTEQSKMLASGKLSQQQADNILMQPLSSNQLSKLSHIAGMKVKDLRAMGTGAHVIILEKDVSKDQLDKIIKKIKQDPSVDYLVEDKIIRSLGAVNPNIQWDMLTAPFFLPQPTWIGDNFANAWSTSNGNGVIVAVIDTGYVAHPNFLSNLQPLAPINTYGYQFISDCRRAGSCPITTPAEEAFIPPEPNGLDLGDFVTAADSAVLGCPVSPSSWHGAHVTGTIVANGFVSGDPDLQIQGGAWGARVVPVRVLGKCGGSASDVIDGSLWAAGLQVPNVPQNLNPAQVLNLSLGGIDSCDAATQDMVNRVNAANVIFMAAAGNETAGVATSNPANCRGALSISAKGPTNKLSWYSNYGPVTIAASGGDSRTIPCDNRICRVYSTVWSATESYTTPGSGPSFAAYQGTSMAAPHAAAAVADVISVLKLQNQPYTPQAIIQILQNSAMPLTNPCNAGGCATNLTLNTANAVNYVQSRIPFLVPNPNSINFTQVSLPVTITFTNQSTSNITIGSIIIPAGFTNYSSTCKSGLNIAPNSTCTISVGANLGIMSGMVGIMRVINGAGTPISTVVLSTLSSSNRSSSGGSGGGCTTIANGDDLSLALLFLSIVIYTYYRRRVLKNI